MDGPFHGQHLLQPRGMEKWGVRKLRTPFRTQGQNQPIFPWKPWEKALWKELEMAKDKLNDLFGHTAGTV